MAAPNLLTRIGRLFALRRTQEQSDPGWQRIAQGTRTLAGVAVTADTAITVPAVWACLRYLSQTVAVLPWHVMRDGERGGELAKTHPVDWLLWKRPAPEWSSFQFRETLTHWALRYGNGYAEIQRDTLGRPYALWPLHPTKVRVEREGERLVYEVTLDHGGKVTLEADDVFHIRGFGEDVVGVNVIAYAAQSIGWARAAQLFGAAFFGNGMNAGGVIEGAASLEPAGLTRLMAEMAKKYGGVRNAFKTVPLDKGMVFKSTMVEPEKGQFIATNQHLVEEVCRWFGVPPHKVAHLLRSTFNNIEHQAIEVVVDSISPWVKRFEDEADYKLFGTQNRLGFYTKMNMNALLRGDMKARMEFYKGMQFVAAYSPNDILRLEDENTIGPEGDIHVMQQQMVPLKFIAKGPQTPAPTPPAATEPAEEEVPEDDMAAVADRLDHILARAPAHA